ALLVEQEGFAHVGEGDLFGVLERVDRRVLTVARTVPGTEEGGNGREVGMQGHGIKTTSSARRGRSTHVLEVFRARPVRWPTPGPFTFVSTDVNRRMSG